MNANCSASGESTSSVRSSALWVASATILMYDSGPPYHCISRCVSSASIRARSGCHETRTGIEVEPEVCPCAGWPLSSRSLCACTMARVITGSGQPMSGWKRR